MPGNPTAALATQRFPRRSVPTWGLTHLALDVRDPARSFAFYARVFGLRATYEDEETIEAQTPGSKDVISFGKKARSAGQAGGVRHFGFRLRKPQDIGRAVRAIESAGGTIRDRGEFSPGHPYVFFRDLDGYEVEVWYE